jgi:putative DNA primase/helicase
MTNVTLWRDWVGGFAETVDFCTKAMSLFRPRSRIFMGADASARGAAVSGADDTLEIARLAALPPLEYDRERATAAERLGCRVSTLDAAVSAARGATASEPNGQGRPLDLPDLAPWPRAVDAALLLDRLARAIRRYVVLDPQEADGVALWVLAAHAFDTWVIFPRLFVTAPEKRCGKSTMLDVVSGLVPRPLLASGITAEALFRTIEAARPTLLLDEADAYARDNEELRAVLDAGHRRDGAVIRLVGDNHEPRQFSVWAPIALAAIGHLPDTIEDRSIILSLRRRRPDEAIYSFRLDRTARLDALARMAARWAQDYVVALAKADPVMPAGMHNRLADNWRPLLAIADLAAGEWPARARRAAVELSRHGNDEEPARVLLLGDLRELFDHRPSGGVLFTNEIVAELVTRDDRPWPEYGRSKKLITGTQIAALLKPFKIKTNKTVRRGNETGKGCRREWFEDSFARYLTQVEPVTQSQTGDSAAFDELQSVTPEEHVTDTIYEKPNIPADCDRVTDQKPMSLDEEAVWTG